MGSQNTSPATIYPDDHATDHANQPHESRQAPCLTPPMHPSANPNADPGYLPGDKPAPVVAHPQGLPPASEAGASVVAGEHEGPLDEPVAVLPAGPAAELVLLEPHDEAPAEPYCEDDSASEKRVHDKARSDL